MRISGLDRVVLRARFRTRAQSTEKSTPTAASFSATTEAKLMEGCLKRQNIRGIIQQFAE
jgi:hypothetical protein